MVNIRASVIMMLVNSVGIKVRGDGLRNRVIVRVFINIMLAYSARKNSVNGLAPYSTLNPDTSSDSPSVRSNGARFVSASVDVYHIIISGHVVGARGRGSCVVMRVCNENPPLSSTMDSTIMASVTS